MSCVWDVYHKHLCPLFGDIYHKHLCPLFRMFIISICVLCLGCLSWASVSFVWDVYHEHLCPLFGMFIISICVLCLGCLSQASVSFVLDVYHEHLSPLFGDVYHKHLCPVWLTSYISGFWTCIYMSVILRSEFHRQKGSETVKHMLIFCGIKEVISHA